MNFLKRFAEWYLGVPPADPGQGTAWRFSSESPWPAWMPPWLVLLVVVAAVAFIVWVYRRDAVGVSRGKRLALVGLRLGAIAIVLLLLTELKVSVDRTGLPVVAVLIDVSGSMGFEDEYSDEAVAQAVARLLEEQAAGEARPPHGSAPTRLNVARALLVRNEGELLKRLLRRNKLRIYRFAETAVPLGQREEYLRAEEIDELLPALAKLEADGDQTRPGPAVRKVLNDLRGSPPSAIVLLTDGITSTTDADRLTTVAETAAGNLVPIFTIGIGSEEPARDVQVYGLLADEVAFVGDPITFSYKLKSYGYENREVTVALREKGTEAVLDRRTVRAGPDGQSVRLEFTHVPSEEGDYDFFLEAAPLPNESNLDNNASNVQRVSVRREPIRVLLADAVPRYEFRYLKHLLEREALRDEDNTLELHTVLQDADLEYAQEDRTAVEHFPVRREDLFQYDVVVFGDLDPAYLSPAVLDNLSDFVREAGGGVIFIAGPGHMPLSYQGTPVETMLPVQLSGAKAPAANGAIVDSFRPELTPEGLQGTSIFRFAETEPESIAVWRELPELYWLFEAPELKPGAFVFARHPARGGAEGPLPVIAMQRFGAGKVLFHGTDELWRWRFRRGDAHYRRYWVQAIRYLTRSRLLGKDRGAVLTSDRDEYEQGDTVHLRLRFLDERLAPTDRDGATVMVERRGGLQQPVTLARLPESPAVFEGQINRVAEGSYHAWVVSPSFADAPPSDGFIVESKSRELLRRSLDRQELVQTARATRGRFYTPADADGFPDDVPAGQPVPLESQEPLLLWNRWELLTLFSLVLLSEWILRKRSRLV